MLWQAHAGALWARFTIALRRALAALLGVKGAEFRDHARLSYAKVAEYQRRGLVHFHAVIRLDGPDGPADAPPAGLDLTALRTAIIDAATASALTVERPDGTALRLGWGPQHDLREVSPTARAQIEDEDGEITDAALASYIAKYATKGTGATRGRGSADPRHHARGVPADQRPPPPHDHHSLGARRGPALRRAEPAALGAHAGLPRPLPHQVPSLLHHLQAAARAATDLATAHRPGPARPRHRRPQQHPAGPGHRHRDQRLVARPLRPPRRRRTRTRPRHRRTPARHPPSSRTTSAGRTAA